MKEEIKICVVGLGYVGLPLAVKFGFSKFETFGLDVNVKKVNELNEFYDSMNEVNSEDLKKTKATFTTDPKIISKADFIIVAVPTPVNKANQPDIKLLKLASEMIGKHIKKGTTIVYESTVYPGCTEEDCVPVVEKFSNMKCGDEFFVGYSPERINPGDKEHTIDKIVKVVSGMDDKTLDLVARVYEEIVTVGVHRAQSIKVAEAAKVIENTQRDINIALMNELALIFDKLNIPTNQVLEAAGTKWNFLKFTPGLVGGHCIGVDPYYLVHKANLVGVHPQIISAGRKINDKMPFWIAGQIIKMLIKSDKTINNSKLLALGLTFKENVNDMRNSKAKELINELKEFGVEVIAHDPYLTKEEVKSEFDLENIEMKEFSKYKEKFDGIIHITSHKEFDNLKLDKIRNLCNEFPIFYDVKSKFKKRDLEKYGFSSKNL